MKYVLLIAGEEAVAAAHAQDGCGGWDKEMLDRGVLYGGAGLRPPADATTVRVRNDTTLLTDGPYAESREQIGGFCLIDCADLDEAIEIAAKHPAATYGSIEVRPLLEP